MIPSLPDLILRPGECSASELQPLTAVLKSAGLTRRRLKKLDAIVQVREQRRDRKPEKAYSARPFVLCGIPVRRPAKHALEYSRQNGRFRLRVIGHPDYGLPFGQDRLLLIWIATMAVWQRTREVRFRSAAILEAFDLPKDGRYYKRLIAGFERIFYSTFFFTSDQQVGEATVMERQSFRFVKNARLWYAEPSPSEPTHASQARTENVIVLSEEFWNEIQEHPIPVDLAVVKALADSPGNLDLYVWLVWRCWTAKGPVTVPLFGHEGLISQLGNSANLRERDFRRQIVQWLKVIRQLWPECPANVIESGASLRVRPSKSIPRFSTASCEFRSGDHVTEFAQKYVIQFALIRDRVRGDT
ncbi:MAG TPA: replication protein RepA [Terriglobia bacterium]|nr:replication protein RepA [Terriglobia bacterium]